MNFRINNSGTCGILEDMLLSYTNIVDDQTRVNNYADPIKQLTSNVSELECSQWQTNLHNFNVEKYLKDLPCGSTVCKQSDVTEEHLSILFKKDSPNDVKNEITQELGRKTHNFAPSITEAVNKKPNYDNKPSIDSDRYNVFKTSKNESCPQINSRNEKPSNGQESGNNNNKFGMFKTARDELQAQNLKKYGHNGGNEQQQANLNYGAQKRSLGTRRGVQNKFIPPVKVDE